MHLFNLLYLLASVSSKFKAEMASFVRITALLWADLLAGYAMWVMMTYLTNVWKLSFTHAAGIVNIWGGIASILPIGLAFLVDTFMGNFSMLLISSMSYSIGLGFLTMSTPPVFGSCHNYKPECIGHTQKVLFYAALALIAVGISGHVVSLAASVAEQTSSEDENEDGSINLWQIPGFLAVVLVPIIGGIALPYIRPWSIRFGIPAICTLVATLLFLTGSCKYQRDSPQGSPLTATIRVFVASSSKIFEPLPDNAKFYGIENPGPHSLAQTCGLRCLDKAAMISPVIPLEQQIENKWKLCSVTEVEETKIGIRMFPMWVTFIVCGMVLSIGNTYFLEQANHMNRKVGKLTVPLPMFLLFYNSAKSASTTVFTCLVTWLGAAGIKKYAPPIGISLAMIFSILCCITAASVETRRLHVIRDHGLLEKPDEKIPMNIFWLLPQFVLLAALDGLSQNSISCFFTDQAPPSMKSYLLYFTNGVLGLGTMASVLSVYVVGKISEKGSKPNWFQYTLSKSRLDRYYWTLAAVSAANLVLYIVVACFYSYRESGSEDEEEERENGDFREPYEENSPSCCCCG